MVLDMKLPLSLRAKDCSHSSACNPRTVMQIRIQALVAVGVSSMILPEIIKFKPIRLPQSGRGQIPVMVVPTATSIPFCSVMDLPLAFFPNATLELASCHLAKMTTADFLEDGEWAGFHSWFYSPGHCVVFDPPMHGIQFFAIGVWYEMDGMWAFDLQGHLIPGTGRIILKKSIQDMLENGSEPA